MLPSITPKFKALAVPNILLAFTLSKALAVWENLSVATPSLDRTLKGAEANLL
jgi:hypothetical protein